MNGIYREKRFFGGMVFYVLGAESMALAVNTYLLWLVTVVDIPEEERMTLTYVILALMVGALIGFSYLHQLLAKYQEQIGLGKWDPANQPMLFMPILIGSAALRSAMIVCDGEETRWFVWLISLSPWFLVLMVIFLRSIMKSLAREDAAKTAQQNTTNSTSKDTTDSKPTDQK